MPRHRCVVKMAAAMRYTSDCGAARGLSERATGCSKLRVAEVADLSNELCLWHKLCVVEVGYGIVEQALWRPEWYLGRN
jgi:hypothetical protein